MSDPSTYLLDADTFIRAKREHYAPDFCPGFWAALLHSFKQGRVTSIEPIRKELLRGNDALAAWVKDKVPDAFFESIDDGVVQAAYADVIAWVEENDQYSRAAKQQFVKGADPWLIAVAIARDHVLVSYEVSKPESKVQVKLPDVARHFHVKCIAPYVMLRKLGIRLNFEQPTKKEA